MRIVWSAALAFVLGVGSAAAEPPSTEDSFAPSLRELDLAVGVNVPLGWSGANSVGASAYLGIGNHHALRANFASYVNTNLRAQDLAAFLLHPSEFLEGDDVLIHSGRITDVGLGWVFYPRSQWRGLTLEAGVLRRARDIATEELGLFKTSTDTTTYAGRAMVGWSWVLYRHVFVALAVGLSVGWERGAQETVREFAMTSSDRVGRTQVDAEGYLRVGFALDR